VLKGVVKNRAAQKRLVMALDLVEELFYPSSTVALDRQVCYYSLLYYY
jgi:hypothetical protein